MYSFPTFQMRSKLFAQGNQHSPHITHSQRAALVYFLRQFFSIHTARVYNFGIITFFVGTGSNRCPIEFKFYCHNIRFRFIGRPTARRHSSHCKETVVPAQWYGCLLIERRLSFSYKYTKSNSGKQVFYKKIHLLQTTCITGFLIDNK